MADLVSFHLCPRCRERNAPDTTTYCNPCSAEYAQEQRRGEHARGRLCGHCGTHFNTHGKTSLCPDCRVLFREKTCSKCDQLFWSEGASLECPECKRRRQRDYMRVYKQAHQGQDRDKKFSLQPGEWQGRLAAQDGKCAACRKKLGTGRSRDGACMDHDHRCCGWNATTQRPVCGGCNRDILCKNCNSILGLAGDEPDVLEALLDYVLRW